MICCSPCRRTPRRRSSGCLLTPTNSASPPRTRLGASTDMARSAATPPESASASTAAAPTPATGASAAQVARTSRADREPSQQTGTFPAGGSGARYGCPRSRQLGCRRRQRSTDCGTHMRRGFWPGSGHPSSEGAPGPFQHHDDPEVPRHSGRDRRTAIDALSRIRNRSPKSRISSPKKLA